MAQRGHCLFDGDVKTREKALKQIEKTRLAFEPNDIKYIIIKDEAEISEFISHLQGVKAKFSYADVQQLTTRIITLDQLNNDI